MFIQGHLFAQSLIGNFATSGKHLAGTGSHQSSTVPAVSLLTKPKACLAFSAFEESQKPKKIQPLGGGQFCIPTVLKTPVQYHLRQNLLPQI